MDRGKRGRAAAGWLAIVVIIIPLTSGCVTVAEFRKLERRVQDMQGGALSPPGSSQRERTAQLASQIDELERTIQQLDGRLEVAEHQAAMAVDEARAARSDAAARPAPAPNSAPAPTGEPSADAAATGPASAVEATASPHKPKSPPAEAPLSAEVESYRAAYASWREGDAAGCVDRFRNFLQTYPASARADDAAYWLADCYFKQGDFKTAVLRFDDVVSRYPTGGKAADALYRQGEALLRMGPRYGNAAGKAFERVVEEYPDSGRAPEAKRQLDLLSSG